MIDDLVGAMLADNGRLRGSAHDCNDSRAEQMRELNASQANPAGAARHENRFTSLELRPLDQRIPGGKISVQDGRPYNEIHVGWKKCGARFFGDHAFRKTTEPTLATDPITGTEATDVVAAGNHDSGGVRSWDVGESRPQLIAAASHQVVHVADGRGVDVDQNLISGRVRLDRLSDV